MSIKNSRNAPLARHPSQNGFVFSKAILTACTILLSSLYLAQDFLLFDFGSSEGRCTSGSALEWFDTSFVHKGTLKIVVILQRPCIFCPPNMSCFLGLIWDFSSVLQVTHIFFQVPHIFQVKCLDMGFENSKFTKCPFFLVGPLLISAASIRRPC